MNDEYFLSILSIVFGIIKTLQYSIFGILFGTLIGIIISIFENSSNLILKLLSKLYVSFFRGTPLILQISLMYFGIPQVFEINIPTFFAIGITLALNSGAYISQVIKSGLQSISKGQVDAAIMLNISRFYMYKDIIMPQVIRKTMPAFINEFISLIKETSIISFFGELDIMRKATLVSVEYYTYFGPLLFAGFIYYLLTLILSYFAKYLETKFYYK